MREREQKRRREEEASIQTFTNQRWRDDFFLAFLQQFVDMAPEQMIQANALPPLP